MGIQGTAEQTRESKQIVHLIRIIASACTHDPCPGILGFLCKNYSLSIEAGLMRTSLPFSDIQADVAPDRSGLILRYSEKKYDRASRTELLKKFGNAAIEDGIPVYISVDNQPLFSVQREDLAEKGIVHITGICVLERNRIVSRIDLPMWDSDRCPLQPHSGESRWRPWH